MTLTAGNGPLLRRPLGRTGAEVTVFALGGEGVLRTHGRTKEAAAVIHAALNEGVNYCDTAPAYDGSMDYYGDALAERRRCSSAVVHPDRAARSGPPWHGSHRHEGVFPACSAGRQEAQPTGGHELRPVAGGSKHGGDWLRRSD